MNRARDIRPTVELFLQDLAEVNDMTSDDILLSIRSTLPLLSFQIAMRFARGQVGGAKKDLFLRFASYLVILADRAGL